MKVFGVLILLGAVAGLTAFLLLVPRQAAPVVCPQCTIVLERRVTIRPKSNEPGILTSSQLARGRNGYFYVTPSTDAGEVSVFDSTGHFVRSFGGLGDGPGEMRDPRKIKVSDNDTLYVLDDAQSTVKLFLANGRFVGTRAATGRVVDFAPTSFGFVLHTLGRGTKGAVQLLQGDRYTTLESIRSQGPWLGSRVVGVDSADNIWVGHKYRYRFDVYDAEGEREFTFVPRVRWFPTMLKPTRGYTSLMDVKPAAHGVWLLFHKNNPSPNPRLFGPWQRTAQGETLARELTVAEMAEWGDYVIEAVDLRSRRGVASVRLKNVGGLLDSEMIYTFEEDPNGEPIIAIYRLRLVKP